MKALTIRIDEPVLKALMDSHTSYTPEKIERLVISYLKGMAGPRLVGIRCPSCGSTALQSRGWKHRKHRMVRRYRCKSCGRGFHNPQEWAGTG